MYIYDLLYPLGDSRNVMKKLITGLLLFVLSLQVVTAQNNVYELHDECYPLFQQAELLVGQEGFDAVNQAFLDKALETGDTKSLTLYYAERLKNLSAVTRAQRLVITLVISILLVILAFFVIYTLHLRRTNEKVRMADAAKTRFVQNMSHEVRTPLNAIVGFSQLLSLPDGSFSEEEKQEFAGHIVNNTKMLTMLLDDILHVSAMDSGGYRIAYEEGEMHYLAQAAISSAEHRLRPGVRMYYAPESKEPYRFTTDPRRVQQILINLLTNACKNTDQGEIRLTSSLTQAPGYVTYAVEDTGPGVPPQQAEVIFERFSKLNEFVQGTGLGLSICRDIAQRMNARVYLDTAYTGGARFVLELPLVPENATTSVT